MDMVTGIIQRIKKNKFFNPLKVDIHSHILPGIDDGAKDIDESMNLIKKFKLLGYEKLITTPHVMADSYNNSTKKILEKLNFLKQKVTEIKIETSAEYYVDEEFQKRLENKDLLPFGKKYILFETSYYTKPNNLEYIIFDIKSLGFIPVFAHPERYRYLQDNFKEYEKLKSLGVLFQCNINSIGGHYGKIAQKIIEKLAKNKMIDFLGSDVHSMKHLEFMKEIFKTKIFKKIYENNKILNNTLKD